MNKAQPLQVALFTGCTVNFIDPGIGLDTLAVLGHNGIEVLHPGQKCCGIPLLAYGYNKAFNQKASSNIRSLASTGCDTVTPCTSCAHALKEAYPALATASGVQTMAERTFDIMEYLVLLQKRSLLNVAFHRMEMHVLYHAPCHLKCLGETLIDERLRLLQRIPGIHLERIDRGCCGMGGTFGMKKKNYTVSMSIGAALAEGIRAAKPDMVVTDCPGCRMQIEHITGIAGLSVQHPVRLLKLAYGIK